MDELPKFIHDGDSRDASINKLLREIDEISPSRLGGTSYNTYIKQLSKLCQKAIQCDTSCLIHILDAIKSCKKPCYKRDVLLEVLNQIVFSLESIIEHLLCDTSNSVSMNSSWKIFANSITTMPDLVANNGGLSKYPSFQPQEFFTTLLCQLHQAFDKLCQKKIGLCDSQIRFYTQILGRVAISGYSHLVWEKFTSKVFDEKEEDLKSMISTVLTYPLQTAAQAIPGFELFIEPLLIPIFFYLKPSKNNGEIIHSVLDNHLIHNELFQYIICNKSIFQANHKNSSAQRQAIILFNIFAHLSHQMTNECGSRSRRLSEEKPSRNAEHNLLIKTLLEIAQSWSNSTKILLRSYEQSRYLTSAFIVAFRYALESDKQNLLAVSEAIQSSIMRGFPIYLNRSTSEYRNLALCIGETVMQALHELIDENLPKDQQRIREPLKLDFGVELDNSSSELKSLFRTDLEELFRANIEIVAPLESTESKCSAYTNCTSSKELAQSSNSEKKFEELSKKSHNNSVSRAKDSTVRPIVELDSDSDDLSPHEMSDENDCDDECGEVVGEDLLNIPIYLQDCIDGLIENNNPRYVKLCLMKAGELVKQLSEQEATEVKCADLIKQQNCLPCTRAGDTFVNDAIRDNARELAQLLLYLDDQYAIENFDTLRMSAMSSLCAAAPDLVVKYLLEEFNGSYKSARHQLDILQALVESARQLSSGPQNKFVKYVSLYFYGIVHQLNSNLRQHISPIAAIVSATKTQKNYDDDDGSRLDDSYLLSRTFLSIAVILECVSQQPITCKLSNDLIDILVSYKFHSDLGVRKAIISCLTAIRNCTPKIYFEEHIADKAASCFGDWLVNEFETLQLASSSRSSSSSKPRAAIMLLPK